MDCKAGGGENRVTQKRKARPAGSAAEQAKQGNHRISGNPSQKFTTRGGNSQFKIKSLLMVGKKNGLHLSDLVRLTDWTEREVRQMIHNERREGIPIISDCKNGYFLPACDEERTACIRQMRSRAKEILAAAAGIERGEVR